MISRWMDASSQATHFTEQGTAATITEPYLDTGGQGKYVAVSECIKEKLASKGVTSVKSKGGQFMRV